MDNEAAALGHLTDTGMLRSYIRCQCIDINCSFRRTFAGETFPTGFYYRSVYPRWESTSITTKLFGLDFEADGDVCTASTALGTFRSQIIEDDIDYFPGF